MKIAPQVGGALVCSHLFTQINLWACPFDKPILKIYSYFNMGLSVFAPNRLTTSILLTFMYWLMPFSSFCQITNEWSLKPSIGIYYTPIKINRYGYSTGISPGENYFENTTNLTFALPINAKFRVGGQFSTIAQKVIREPTDRSYMVGIYGQYNLRARKRLGVYIEGGYAIGNLCTCGNAESYSSDTINHFLPIGVGIDYKLTSLLHLKAGFINYKPITGQHDLYNWTQPFLGANFYFYKKYKTPLKSRFIKKSEPIPKEQRNFFWEDERSRKWTFGFTTSGISVIQNEASANQSGPLLKYREFTFVPRLNYWLNQAVMVGAQGTYYHYENNYDNIIPLARGYGVGVQARFYPLSFKNTDKFRAIRIGKRANWNVSPIVGIEVHWANFSWLDPHAAGNSWQYYDFQPYAGFILSYKRWFNLFYSVGPTVSTNKSSQTSPVNGVRILGLEYNFLRK